MTTLDPGDANALVQLRALLDHARQAARTAAPVARLTALVLLDAVNERVTHLAVQTLPNVNVTSRAQFEDMYGAIKTALGTRLDSRHGWAEARRLHRARNDAQHEGLGGDPALLPGWIAATELYTRSLVLATFGVDLDQVHLAEAINDPELADHLRVAEQQLHTGDAAAALTSVRDAFNTAFRAWLDQHKDAHQTWSSPPRSFDEFREIGKMIEGSRNLTAAQAFAYDPAEYTWFSQLTHADPESVTTDEAERALVFVFWWIVRWEAINATWVSNRDRYFRWMERELVAKARTEPDRSTRIDRFSVERVGLRSQYRITFALVDVPAAEQYPNWSAQVDARLKGMTQAGIERWMLEQTGDINVYVTSDVDTDVLVNAVRQALAAADHDIAEIAEQGRRDAEREEARRAAFTASVEQLDGQFPTWVRKVYLSAKGITSGWQASQLRVAFGDDLIQHLRHVRDLLVAHELIGSALIRGDEIQVEPELTADDLITVLREIDHEVTSLIEANAQLRRNDVAAMTSFNDRLAASLNRSGAL